MFLDEDEVLLDTVLPCDDEDERCEEDEPREEDELLEDVLRDEDVLFDEEDELREDDVLREDDGVVRRVWAYPSIWNAARAISIAAIAALQ